MLMEEGSRASGGSAVGLVRRRVSKQRANRFGLSSEKPQRMLLIFNPCNQRPSSKHPPAAKPANLPPIPPRPRRTQRRHTRHPLPSPATRRSMVKLSLLSYKANANTRFFPRPDPTHHVLQTNYAVCSTSPPNNMPVIYCYPTVNIKVLVFRR